VPVALYPSGPRRQALQAAGQPAPAPAVFNGLIDTGATVTIIDPRVRQALNLVPYRIRPIGVPAQPVPVYALWYKLDLVVFDPRAATNVSLYTPMLSVVETPISHSGADVLVGCDVLSRCFFGYGGTTRDFILAF